MEWSSAGMMKKPRATFWAGRRGYAAPAAFGGRVLRSIASRTSTNESNDMTATKAAAMPA
jgi:hypothetical protein